MLPYRYGGEGDCKSAAAGFQETLTEWLRVQPVRTCEQLSYGPAGPLPRWQTESGGQLCLKVHHRLCSGYQRLI